MMAETVLFRVTGEMENYGDDEWLVSAESAEDAKAVWTDGENGGYTEEDGFSFKGAEEVPADELIEFGGSDDGWEGTLPEGAKVLSRYDGGPLDGQPDQVVATAAAWGKFFGRLILTDPNA
jgi:hypothetical protein